MVPRKLAGIWKMPINRVGGVRNPPVRGAGRSRFHPCAEVTGHLVPASMHATRDHERVEREVGLTIPEHLVISMNFKREYSLPSHLEDDDGLPRNREERLLWIRRKVQQGYYDETRVIRAVADAFLEPNEVRRAGDRS